MEGSERVWKVLEGGPLGGTNLNLTGEIVLGTQRNGVRLVDAHAMPRLRYVRSMEQKERKMVEIPSTGSNSCRRGLMGSLTDQIKYNLARIPRDSCYCYYFTKFQASDSTSRRDCALQ